MGRYLEFAGKLYFAELDVTDIMASDSYDVAATRDAGEAVTGYEAEKEYIYGKVSGIDFGGMFMDVDMDSHSAVSLTGDKKSEKEYFFTTGIMGSTYESGIWEELTGEPAVSTISILEEAKEQGTEILVINKSNLDESLSLLKTTDEIVSEIESSVSGGHVVIMPEEDVHIGGWNGTGYIILDMNSGSGIYRISGGLNGGYTQGEVMYDTMVEFGLTLADIVEGMLCIFQVINVMKTAEAISLLGTGQILFAGVCMALSIWSCVQTFKLFDAYMDGDEAAGEEIVKQTLFDAAFTLGLTIFSKIAKPILKLTMKKKLIKMLGTDVVEELLSNGAEIEDLSKLVKNLKNLSVSEELISEFAKKFGDKGLDWLRQARGLSVSADIVTEFSKLEEFADNMDDILEVIKKSSRSADEVAECLIKYGDKAAEAIRKYGDDAVDAISKYGDDALDVIDKYGDDAAKGFKDGKTPDEVEKELGGREGSIGFKGQAYDGIRNPGIDFVNGKGESTLAKHAESHGYSSENVYLNDARNFLESLPNSTTQSFVSNEGTYFRYDTATNEFGIINMGAYQHILNQMMV